MHRDHLVEYIHQLQDWIMNVNGWTSTCDWGDCDEESVGYRASPESGRMKLWLPVCKQHLDEAPPIERLPMIQIAYHDATTKERDPYGQSQPEDHHL